MATNIMGSSKATASQMESYLKKVNPSVSQKILNVIPFYISEGNLEGVRGDVAFAQSCLETGNFTFSGSAVTFDQNNFAGMGVTSNGMKGNSYSSPQIGIRAQIQHLKAYASKDALRSDCVDARFKYVTRGSAPYVEWLGIQENPSHAGWAAGANYGNKILNILNTILSMPNNGNANINTNESGGNKMKINVHGGHNKKVPGAAGWCDEVDQDRIVTNYIISKLQKLGHTVYNCTDDAGSTSSQNLANIVSKCNAHKVDLDVSIHFNAFNNSAHGTEVWVHSTGSSSYKYAQNIASYIAKQGYTNRGVKTSTGLYVLKNTVSPALLVECCFCDAPADQKIYNAERMAEAIVMGIAGKLPNEGPNPGPHITIGTGAKGMKFFRDAALYSTPGGSKTGTIKSGTTNVNVSKRCWCGGKCYFYLPSSNGWVIGDSMEGWVSEAGKWWYLLDKYTYPKNQWQKVDGVWYYFNADGWMYSNTLLCVKGKYYAILPSGKCANKMASDLSLS